MSDRRYRVEERLYPTSEWRRSALRDTMQEALYDMNPDSDQEYRVIDTVTGQDVTRDVLAPIRKRNEIMDRFCGPDDAATAAQQAAMIEGRPVPEYNHAETVRAVRASLTPYELALIGG